MNLIRSLYRYIEIGDILKTNVSGMRVTKVDILGFNFESGLLVADERIKI